MRIKIPPLAMLRTSLVPTTAILVLACTSVCGAQTTADGRSSDAKPVSKQETKNSKDLLTPQQWQQVDATVDRGLEYLVKQQQEDGSFETLPIGQPGVTSLCVMAFLSRGHMPDQGPYGQRIASAIDFVLDCQQADGLICDMQVVRPPWAKNSPAHTAIYNHVISALMLTEVYGMTAGEQSQRIRKAIPQALAFSLRYEDRIPKRPGDAGGFRYVRPLIRTSSSDVSVTAWQLTFFRSARNAEFEVPTERIDEAVTYIARCFSRRRRLFVYGLHGGNLVRPPSRGVQGAAIVSLSMGGKHGTKMAQQAATWVIAQTFDDYNRSRSFKDRYHYSAYYCSQAMFQLGGEYWAKFYPRLMQTLAANQRQDGSWDRESVDGDGRFGFTYTTALSVLALAPAYQILPIYQR
jgi:hypothetical protein